MKLTTPEARTVARCGFVTTDSKPGSNPVGTTLVAPTRAPPRHPPPRARGRTAARVSGNGRTARHTSPVRHRESESEASRSKVALTRPCGSTDTRGWRQRQGRGPPRSCHDECMSDDLVSVLWTSSLVEAEIAKGRLEAESIPVQLKGEGADARTRSARPNCSFRRDSRRRRAASLGRTRTAPTGPELGPWPARG